jgi:hypothetical protein
MTHVHPTAPAAIVALLLATAAPLRAQPAPSAPAARESGIYLEKPEGRDLTRLAGVVPDIRATGMVKMMVTSGLAKGEMLGRISGEHATLRTPDQPVFDFYLPSGSSNGSPPPSTDPNHMDLNQMMRGMQGDLMPPNFRDANDFALIRLVTKDGGREAHLGSLGGRGGPKNTVACAVEKLANGAFRVRPKEPLAAGEYAFTVAKQGQAGQLWDFGVDGK